MFYNRNQHKGINLMRIQRDLKIDGVNAKLFWNAAMGFCIYSSKIHSGFDHLLDFRINIHGNITSFPKDEGTLSPNDMMLIALVHKSAYNEAKKIMKEYKKDKQFSEWVALAKNDNQTYEYHECRCTCGGCSCC